MGEERNPLLNELHRSGLHTAKMYDHNFYCDYWIWIFSEIISIPQTLYKRYHIVEYTTLYPEAEIGEICFYEKIVSIQYKSGYVFELPHNFPPDILGLLGKLRAPRKPY